MEKNFQQGVRDALPTALGYISIGLACGVVASTYLSPLEMGLMSLLVYAGASQFAMISLIAVHSSLMNIALTVFFINLRNMLMSLHTSPDFMLSFYPICNLNTITRREFDSCLNAKNTLKPLLGLFFCQLVSFILHVTYRYCIIEL